MSTTGNEGVGGDRQGAALRPYSKPWLSLRQQLELLRSRGLGIDRAWHAEQLLAHLNYYRLSGYCLAFEAERHRFLDGAHVEDVEAAHAFDVALRGWLDQALEAVEVDLRATIASAFGRMHGPFGHCDATRFHAQRGFASGFVHSEWIRRARLETVRSREAFVKHFRMHYSEYPDLPIWMLTEVLSFGALSKMYAGLGREDQRAIASRYGIQPRFLQSWLHHLVCVRNICAHHGRVWDRVWSVKPQLPPHALWLPPAVPSNERPYATMLILLHLIRRITAQRDAAESWRRGVVRLLAMPPRVEGARALLGMPEGWESDPRWRGESHSG
jgi:abortive infection bacteriophage resistance protein